MLASDRLVYGREFYVTPLWVWVLQRISGLLLAPLVALHIWMPGLADNAVLNALLLAIVVGHGYSGLRRWVLDRGRDAIFWLTIVWCVLVALFGVLVVLLGV